jgi:hypothetical protein
MEADSDLHPHQSGKLDQDQDPHQSEKVETFENYFEALVQSG